MISSNSLIPSSGCLANFFNFAAFINSACKGLLIYQALVVQRVAQALFSID